MKKRNKKCFAIIIFLTLSLVLGVAYEIYMYLSINREFYGDIQKKYISSQYNRFNYYQRYENNILGNTSQNLYFGGNYVEGAEDIVYLSRDEENLGIIRFHKENKQEKLILEDEVRNLCISGDRLYYIKLMDQRIYSCNLNGKYELCVYDNKVLFFQIVADELVILAADGQTLIFGKNESYKIKLGNAIQSFMIVGNRIYYNADSNLYYYDMPVNKAVLVYENCLDTFLYEGKFVCETINGIEIVNSKGKATLLVDGNAYIVGVYKDRLYYAKEGIINSITLEGTDLQQVAECEGYIKNPIFMNDCITFDDIIVVKNKLKATSRKVLIKY